MHELGAPHYDTAQRHAWAPRQQDATAWVNRLAGLRTLLAHEGDELAGFISFQANGHIVFLYTAPGFARRGVASLLFQQVVTALPGTELFTEASLAAKPLFRHMGFRVVEEQLVLRQGVTLRRYAMRKAGVAHAAAPADLGAAAASPLRQGPA